MNEDKSIENIRKHIKRIRNNSPIFSEREIKIALGKVIIDLKDAQKNGNGKVLKAIFTL